MDDGKTPSYYASGVEINVSPWDVTLRFHLREGNSPKDVHPVAQVILGPQHAYVLARVLSRSGDAYEREVGKFQLPHRLLNDMGIEE